MRFATKCATVAVKNTRSLTTSNGPGANGVSAPKNMLHLPTWGLVGLGVTAAGFFGKILHDDNLATRQELKETSHELRGDIKTLRSEFFVANQETRRELHETRHELREDNKALRSEMKEGFAQINQTLASFKPKQ